MLTSTLGEVQDISASGMRVQFKGKPWVKAGEALVVGIESSDGTVRISVRVVWMRRIGWRRHEIGLHFEDVSPSLAATIGNIARVASMGETMRPRVA